VQAGERALPGEPDRRGDLVFLALLCLTQVLVLSRTRPVFFDGDAFFYFAYPGDGFLKTLSSADITRVYRPLGSIVFSYFFQPLFGLDHTFYWAVALAAHVVNTVLVFFVLDRLLEGRTAVRAGTVFFGLNPVAIYVTHSFSFLADWSYVFFYLVGILAFLRHTRTRSWPSFGLALAAFALGLLSKELAITFPVVLVIVSLLFLRDRTDREFHEAAAQRLVRAAFLLLACYVAFYSTLKGGSLYDSTPGRNYFPQFTLAAVFAKFDSVLGVLFFPIPEKVTSEAWIRTTHRLVYVVAPALGLFLLFVLWPPEAIARRLRGGLLWAFVAAGPVLFLSPLEILHNFYLPSLGLGIAFGTMWQYVATFVGQTGWLRPSLFHLYGIGAVAFSLFVNQQLFHRFNWRPHWEEVARTWVTEVKAQFPKLAPPTQVYVLKSNESDEWNLYSGALLRIYLGQDKLSVDFDDDGAPFPIEAARSGQVLALTMLDEHVRDVTASRLAQAEGKAVERPSLIKQFDRSQVSLLNGRPLDQVKFETPNGSPAFPSSILLGSDFRSALTMLAGTRVRFPVIVGENARLSFGVGKRFEVGDGVVARLYFETEATGRKVLFERTLNPRDVEADRRWLDVELDLSAYKGQSGTLELECTPGANGDYTADWLGWSGLYLEGVRLP
jgi:hypothetical protein